MEGASQSPVPMGGGGRDQVVEVSPHENPLMRPGKPRPSKQLWNEGERLLGLIEPGTLRCGLREPPPWSRLTASPDNEPSVRGSYQVCFSAINYARSRDRSPH